MEEEERRANQTERVIRGVCKAFLPIQKDGRNAPHQIPVDVVPAEKLKLSTDGTTPCGGADNGRWREKFDVGGVLQVLAGVNASKVEFAHACGQLHSTWKALRFPNHRVPVDKKIASASNAWTTSSE